MLAFGVWTLSRYVSLFFFFFFFCSSRLLLLLLLWWWWWYGYTYSIAGGVFLLSSDDEAGSLGGVDGGSALYDGFALGTTAAVLAADNGDGVPVVAHFDLLDVS